MQRSLLIACLLPGDTVHAEFLVDQGAEEAATEYLAKARNADPRPGRELADEGRQGEISSLLQQIGAD